MRRALDVLDELIAPGPATIVDVGCGDGALVRHLAGRGAHAIGVEVADEPLRRARRHPPVADERYERAGAEALPLADATADVVVFMHSLHHVPADRLDDALAEAARVLRPGGLVYVQEPLAEGPLFELLRPVDDETEVRRLAQAALQRAAGGGVLAHERTIRFDAAVDHRSFDDFAERVLLADAGRSAVLPRVEPELRARFEAVAEPVDGGMRLRQPTRVDLLLRT